MDFFKLLKDQHQEAKDTFVKLLGGGEIDRAETELLCNKLLLHMELEEKYFYPRMEEFKKSEELAEEAELEHSEAKKAIRALLKGDMEEVEYKVKLELLQGEIVHHADEEEKDLFPAAKKLLSQEDIQDITEKIMALNEKKQAALAS